MSIDQVIGKLSYKFLTSKGTVLDYITYCVPISVGVLILLVLIMLEINSRKNSTSNESHMLSLGDIIIFSIIPIICALFTAIFISLVLPVLTIGGKEEFVKSYVKGLDTNKVELRELEKDSVEVRDVINKKNDKLYADVWVSEKDKKMGAFISHMKIVRDLESDDASYVTYKKITKSIKYNGNYGNVLAKKGWAKAELHVPAGLKNYEIANHVKASINGEVVE